MMGLTPTQSKVYGIISEALSAGRVPPTYDELKVALGLRSKGNITRIMAGLEARGAIKRIPGKARAYEIANANISVDPPNDTRAAIRDYAQIHGISESVAVAEACRAYFGIAR